jgi:hypothetical protein
MVAFTRALGWVFAVLGPVTLILGAGLTVRGHGGLLLLRHRPTGVTAVVYPVMVAAWLVRFWRPGGYLRAPWRAGSTLDRVLAITATTSLIGFAAPWYTGFTTLSTIALTASALATLPLVVPTLRHGAPPPATNDNSPATPGPEA